MIFSTFKIIDNLIKFNRVKAHCDIPCGIYDPIPAQIAAMTTARMTDTIIELEEHEAKEHDDTRDMHYNNKISRMISEKDRSAEIVKHEIRIIWGDFSKSLNLKVILSYII